MNESNETATTDAPFCGSPDRIIHKRYSIEKIGYGYVVRRILTMRADWHDSDYLSTMSGPYLFTNCIYSAKHFRFKWRARAQQRKLQLKG